MPGQFTSDQWKQIKEYFQAAMDLAPSARTEYLDRVSPALRPEIDSLLAAHDSAGATLETSALTLAHEDAEERDPRLGQQIGPYQVIAKVGQGGMGSVYRAVRVDDHYLKQVAIKVVRAGFGNDQHLRRFKNERQIMASMDHPNIARLLDGGNTDDGLPYFVMEYIEGKRIDEYCDSRNLPTTERLRHFRKVCSAVEYAHQHLVVHRDLKPANIFVTNDGVPKLLDFGIAKLLEPELFLQTAELTSPLAKPMTPEYASPEQVRGESITTVSDVYSLGVLLYRLLTGHSPYRVDSRHVHKLTQAITQTDPEKPSLVINRVEEQTGLSGETIRVTPELVSQLRGEQPATLRRSLSGDLDNIVLKALQKDPSRRYASVEQLSEDIARHGRGLPILARTDTFRYRTSKLIRRHKGIVTAAALVLLTLLIGVIATGWQAYVARSEETRAERRFKDVRDLANSLIFDFDDAIADLPGSTPARKILVSKAVRYLDTLNQEAHGDNSLQSDLAAAYQKLGDVQGNPFRANIGDTPGSLQSYRKAVAIREALAAANPNDLQAQYALAVTYRLLCRVVVTSGDLASGLQYANKALSVMEPIAKADSENLRFLDELENAYEIIGDIQGGNGQSANLGNVAAGLENHRKALAIAETALKKSPNDTGLKRAVAIYDVKTADDMIKADDWPGALRNYRAALEIYRTFDTQSASVRRETSFIQARVGDALVANGDNPGAQAAYREAITSDKILLAADPQNALARQDHAENEVSYARVLMVSGEGEKSLPLLTEGTALIEKEVALDPTNSDLKRTLALVYVWGGESFVMRRNFGEALKTYQRAIATYDSINSADPNDFDLRLSIAATHAAMGKVFLAMSDSRHATASAQKAIALSESAASARPPNMQALYTVADAYCTLGEAAGVSSPQSINWFHKSVAAWKQIRTPGKLTPNGFLAGDPHLADNKLADALVAHAQH